MTQPGLFDVHNRLESLSKAGDPLVLLNEKIDWTKFNGTLLLATSRERKSSAGRKPFPALLMFKNGEVVAQQDGAAPRSKLAAFIDQNI